MKGTVGQGVDLYVAGQHVVAVAVHLDLENPGEKSGLGELLRKLPPIQGNHHRFHLVAVNDRRNAALAPMRPCHPLAGPVTLFGIERRNVSHVSRSSIKCGGLQGCRRRESAAF